MPHAAIPSRTRQSCNGRRCTRCTSCSVSTSRLESATRTVQETVKASRNEITSFFYQMTRKIRFAGCISNIAVFQNMSIRRIVVRTIHIHGLYIHCAVANVLWRLDKTKNGSCRNQTGQFLAYQATIRWRCPC